MFVRDYMSSPVVSVDQMTSLQSALRLMHQHKIKRLAITDQAKALVGIVTERDLIYALPVPVTALGYWLDSPDSAGTPVQDLMAKNPVSVAATASVTEVARLIIEHKIGGVPVVSVENHCLGIVTKSDIIKAFLDHSQHRPDVNMSLGAGADNG